MKLAEIAALKEQESQKAEINNFSDEEIAATMAAFDDCYSSSTGSREEFMKVTEEYAK